MKTSANQTRGDRYVTGCYDKRPLVITPPTFFSAKCRMIINWFLTTQKSSYS